jgi:hypothetical protein
MQSHNAAASNRLPLSSWEPRAEQSNHTFQSEGARSQKERLRPSSRAWTSLTVLYERQIFFVFLCPFCVPLFPFLSKLISYWNEISRNLSIVHKRKTS